VIYEAHELSLAFPDMPPDQFKRLADDIRANGLNHPIVLLDGKILDGRHRYRGCIEVGVAPMFRDFMEGNPDESSHGDPVAFVTSENASRRHLNTSQLAHAIAAMAGWEREQAKKRQAAAGGDKKSLCAGLHEAVIEGTGRTSEKLAAKTGVSARTVDKAIKVREAGIPEVNQAVASGEVSLNMAEKIVKLSPAAQRRVIEAPAKDRADALQTAFVRSDAAKRRDSRADLPVKPEIGTAFIRKFLSSIERLAMICAEDGVKDGGAIATKFMEEMDWDSLPLALQWERAEPVIRALAIIQQTSKARAA
jgi:ParB-like chromosome segregation protein Spo0J